MPTRLTRFLNHAITVIGACCIAVAPASAEVSARLPTHTAAPAQDPLYPERMVVKLRGAAAWGHKPTVRQLETAQRQLEDTFSRSSSRLRWVRPSSQGSHVIEFAPGTANSEKAGALAALQKDADVEWVAVDRRVHPNAVTPLLGLGNVLTNEARSWFLKSATVEPASSNAETLWQRYHGDSRSIVAVVDTGVLPGHPSLQGRILPGFDMIADSFIANDGQALSSGSDRDTDATDPGNGVSSFAAASNPECGGSRNSTWHGTFVAAMIAGNPAPDQQVFPVNWHGQILPVRALGRCGGFTADLADAILWAAGLPVPNTPPNTTPARVINLSLGAAGACSGRIEGAAVAAAIQRGAVVVAATGNSGSVLESPANCPGAIAVGALDQEGLKADYSNHGNAVTLMAPGGDPAFPIWSAGNAGVQAAGANTYTSKTGTSFAAPLVAATASLMLSLDPSLTPADITRLLRQSSRPFVTNGSQPFCSATLNSTACRCTTAQCGAGMLDIAAAINAVKPNQILANLLGPGRVSPGDTGLFDASTSFNPAGGAVNYLWEIVSFSGSVAPVIQSATGARTEVTFPGNSGAYQLRLTVSNGSQLHSVLKNVVIAQPASASADNLTALQTIVAATLTGPSGNTADSTAGGNSTGGNTGGGGTGSGSSDAGGSGTTGPTGGGGGGGGQLPPLSLWVLLAGLVALRRTRAWP